MRQILTSSKAISIDTGLLILRIMAGAAMITHGWPKFQNVINGNFQFGDPIGLGVETSLVLAAFAEFICSLLVIAGFFTRLATIPLIINMSVAFFIAHSADDFGVKEKAFLYLGMFIVLLLTGPGKYSIDKQMGK